MGSEVEECVTDDDVRKDKRTKKELLQTIKDYGTDILASVKNLLEKERQRSEASAALADAEHEIEILKKDHSRALDALELLVESALLTQSPLEFWEKVRENAAVLGYDRGCAQRELTRAFEAVAGNLAGTSLAIITKREKITEID